MSRHARSSRAFTMVELIVVIVVLAILASLAIVGYQRVVAQSRGSAAEASLASIAREAQALAAFEDGNFDNIDYDALRADIVAATAGTHADSWVDLRPGVAGEDEPGVVVYTTADSGATLGLAVLYDPGHVAYARATSSTLRTWHASVSTADPDVAIDETTNPDDNDPDDTTTTTTTPTTPGIVNYPLDYSEDGDTNGLMYWYGTRGRTEPWQNPTATGRVLYWDSAHGVVSATNRSLSDQDQVAVRTFELPAGHKVNLDRVVVAAYDGFSGHMTSFAFSASTNGTTWDTLIPAGELGLSGWQSWPIDSEAGYRYLRITALSGGQRVGDFEFYGSLDITETTSDLDFYTFGDTNGIMHAAGTNFGTQPWQNPVIAGRVIGTGTGVHLLADRSVTSYPDGPTYNFQLPLGVTLTPDFLTLLNYSGSGVTTGFALDGSNDGQTWTTLLDRTGAGGSNAEAPAPGTWRGWNVDDAAGYTRFRIRGAARLQEIELYGDVTRAASHGGLVFDSVGDSNGLFHALGVAAGNGSWQNPHGTAQLNSTGLRPRHTDRVVSGGYDGVTTAIWSSSIAVAPSVLTVRNYGGSYPLTRFSFLGSNDGVTWTPIAAELTGPNSNGTPWQAYQVGDGSGPTYTHFRLDALDVGDRYDEVELYGRIG